MLLLGILVTFLGFLIAFASLGMAAGAGARLLITLAGIGVSLSGIGLLNKQFLRNAIWRK